MISFVTLSRFVTVETYIFFTIFFSYSFSAFISKFHRYSKKENQSGTKNGKSKILRSSCLTISRRINSLSEYHSQKSAMFYKKCICRMISEKSCEKIIKKANVLMEMIKFRLLLSHFLFQFSDFLFQFYS